MRGSLGHNSLGGDDWHQVEPAMASRMRDVPEEADKSSIRGTIRQDVLAELYIAQGTCSNWRSLSRYMLASYTDCREDAPCK